MRMTWVLLTAIALSALGSRLPAQAPRQVSLEDAIRMADRASETVDIARAAVERARGQQLVARSQFLPQLSLQASYARTLASQFEGFSLGGGPDTTANPFTALCAPDIPAAATPAERQAALDQARSCEQGGGGGFDFSSVGFGAKNQWVLGLQFSQNLFTAGRASGLSTAAGAGRVAADIELTAQRAQLILDITQAYYNAVLATRLAEIAESSLAMSDDVLRQTAAARQVGSSSEFDLLRAQVARDNQRPLVLQRRSDATVALLRLKQLLEIPLDDAITLTTDVDVEPATRIAGVSLERPVAPDTSVDSRATVRQAAENVRAQQGLLRVARADRYPTIALTSGYQRLFFPATTFPALSDFRENWTVGFTAGVNLLSGGRTRGNTLSAQADLRAAEARLRQAREFAALDARIALSQLEQAEATYRASRGTAEQARRAYGIDQIRYREGISTQTDLNQSQLLVEQAMVNQAVAARDLAVARMRLALLKDLPLGASGGGMGSTGAGGDAAPPTPQRLTGGQAATSGSVQQ